MGLFNKLERTGLRADQGSLPFDDPRLWTPTGSWDYSDTIAGVGITPESAKRCSAVFACNSLIAETLASLPCVLYKRLGDDGGKERARDHRAYRTARLRPNGWMSTMDFFASGQMVAGMRGNAMAKILDDGVTVELQPMHPSRVVIEQLDNTRMRYQYNNPFGGQETLLQDQVLHVRDLSDDGFHGQARGVLAREAIAVAQAGEAFVGGFFRNNAQGRLVLSSLQTPDEKTKAEHRRTVNENSAGWRNASSTMFLWGGMTATELSKPTDADFLIEPRKFSVADIARFWRVPGFMIGLEEKSTSWGTGLEQQMQGFVDFTLKPWLDRWAQALSRSLLDESEQDEYFFEFLLADLVRGDLASRMAAYKVGHDIGMYSPNDLLKKENENLRNDPGGDEYQQTPTGAAPNASGGPPEPPIPARPAPQPAARIIPAPLLADAVNRIAGREIDDVTRRAARATDQEKWMAWVAKYYIAHREYVVKVLTPLGEAFGFEHWVLEAAAERVERSALGLDAKDAVDFAARRRAAIAELLEETFTAGAAGRAD